jgi:hypothetical protein
VTTTANDALVDEEVLMQPRVKNRIVAAQPFFS